MTRVAAEGQTVDAFADFWLQAMDVLAKLGHKDVHSKAAETRSRVTAFRKEQALGLAHGVRSTSDTHGIMMAEEGFKAVHPRATGGGKADVAAVLCCKERRGGERQQPRVRV